MSHVRFPRARSRGVALITVMLIMVLLTTLVAYLVEDEYLMIRRVSNQQEAEQGFQIAVYAEQWARKILEADIRENNTDHRKEAWYTESPTLRESDTAALSAGLEDLQGRFNLNNLSTGKDDVWYPAFKRLLTVLELDPGLADAVVDWMDSDIDVSGHYGAEDAEYLLESPSYRAANRPMADVGELRHIRGMTDEAVKALRPHVTVLPDTGVRINVNTANSTVMRILSPDILDTAVVEALIDGRGEKGYESVDSFLARTELAGNWEDANSMVSVSSGYFRVESTVTLGRYTTALYSVIERSAATRQATVILRRRGVS